MDSSFQRCGCGGEVGLKVSNKTSSFTNLYCWKWMGQRSIWFWIRTSIKSLGSQITCCGGLMWGDLCFFHLHAVIFWRKMGPKLGTTVGVNPTPLKTTPLFHGCSKIKNPTGVMMNGTNPKTMYYSEGNHWKCSTEFSSIKFDTLQNGSFTQENFIKLWIMILSPSNFTRFPYVFTNLW